MNPLYPRINTLLLNSTLQKEQQDIVFSYISSLQQGEQMRIITALEQNHNLIPIYTDLILKSKNNNGPLSLEVLEEELSNALGAF
jgi:hypothetical protein